MQVIIRFSIDVERNGVLRNRLAAILERAGFVRGGNTATYRHGHIDPAGIQAALNNFWNAAAMHRGNGRVDHFWMYSDRGFLDDMFGGAAEEGANADDEPDQQ